MDEMCKHCGKPIPESRQRYHAKYCSTNCLRASKMRHYQKRGSSIPPGTVGAIAELEVASDLLLKGYEVFRSMSPSCSCDLAILKNGNLLKVEVVTGHYLNERLYAPKKKSETSKYDILAIVVPETGDIVFQGDF